MALIFFGEVGAPKNSAQQKGVAKLSAKTTKTAVSLLLNSPPKTLLFISVNSETKMLFLRRARTKRLNRGKLLVESVRKGCLWGLPGSLDGPRLHPLFLSAFTTDFLRF